MILAHHVIFTAYGFWLPNDPRGSWSDFVIAWELFRAGGPATKVDITRSVAPIPHDRQKRLKTKEALKFQPVKFTGEQARSIANGFRIAVEERNYPVHACSILPEHVHLIVGKADRNISQVAAHLKARATQQLRTDGLHPFAETADPNHTPWARKYWKVFIDDPKWLTAAIAYVEHNPEKDGKRRQKWSFVTPAPFTVLNLTRRTLRQAQDRQVRTAK